MKQLVKISVQSLKAGDLIFDFNYRDLQKVEYISFENKSGNVIGTGTDTVIHNIHVSYGVEADSADNFSPEAQVMILIDTEELKIVAPKDIGYR